MAKVVLDHLTKVFGGPNGESLRAVDNLDLAVAESELLVLVGPSGCGKTTTLRLIAGLESPTAGTISIGCEVVNQISPKDRSVAMVFQSPALYPHLSVYENLAFGLKLRRVPQIEIRRRVSAVAESLGLTACLARLPMTLSGGQRQCVALGRALVRHPKVLLCDEPLSHLDAPTRAQLRADLCEIQKKSGATLLYVTHDQVEAMSLGRRIAVMNAGRIHQVDSPVAIYERPADLFVAGFFGTPPMNFFRGTIRSQTGDLVFVASPGVDSDSSAELILPLGSGLAERLKASLGRDVVLGLRPECIHDARLGGTPGLRPAIKACFRRTDALGSETLVHLAAHGHPFVARVRGSAPVTIGKITQVLFDMDRAHFFDPGTGKNLCVS